MLAAAILATAGWLIGAPPPGSHLVDATEHHSTQTTLYWHTTHDPDDAPLALHAYAHPPFPPPAAGGPTVHGVPAAFGQLTDDGAVYGRSLRWVEGGIGLSVELDGKPPDAKLQALAESVKQVPPERWEVLKTAFGDTPDRPTPDMKAVPVRHGAGWTFTAFLPAGFPVAPEDEREPCFRLTNRGTSAASCGDLPRWKRLKGAVFVFGIAPPRTTRITVVGRGVKVRAPTGRAPGYPLASFFAVRLPGKACDVHIGGQAFEIDAGPATGGSAADRRRCARST